MNVFVKAEGDDTKHLGYWRWCDTNCVTYGGANANVANSLKEVLSMGSGRNWGGNMEKTFYKCANLESFDGGTYKLRHQAEFLGTQDPSSTSWHPYLSWSSKITSLKEMFWLS